MQSEPAIIFVKNSMPDRAGELRSDFVPGRAKQGDANFRDRGFESLRGQCDSLFCFRASSSELRWLPVNAGCQSKLPEKLR